MESLDEITKSTGKPGFFKHVFNFNEESKAEMLAPIKAHIQMVLDKESAKAALSTPDMPWAPPPAPAPEAPTPPTAEPAPAPAPAPSNP